MHKSISIERNDCNPRWILDWLKAISLIASRCLNYWWKVFAISIDGLRRFARNRSSVFCGKFGKFGKFDSILVEKYCSKSNLSVISNEDRRRLSIRVGWWVENYIWRRCLYLTTLWIFLLIVFPLIANNKFNINNSRRQHRQIQSLQHLHILMLLQHFNYSSKSWNCSQNSIRNVHFVLM